MSKPNQPWDGLNLRMLTLAFLMAATTLLWPSTARAQRITTIEENGRKIFVNDQDPYPAPKKRAATASPRYVKYVYWSNTEHRWKPVAPASPNVMRAARSAAAEVSGYVATMPMKSVVVSNTETGRVNPNYQNLVRGRLVSSEAVDDAIETAARKHNVDPNLVRAIIKVESGGNPSAVSRKGAMGLMQLMPATARELKVSNPFDPAQNVDAGVRHLKGLLDNFRGDLNLTLAAYNAGEGAVLRNGGVPPYSETRSYVRRITSLYGRGGSIALGLTAPLSAPIHVSRDERGVLKITNTE
jgi:soluble lytic murein transglycosylase-like protein